MVCSQCTLLHPEYAVVCSRCGYPLRGALERITARAVERVPVGVGVASGGSLLLCLAIALIAPAASGQVLGIGAYFGLISITNIWLAVYRDGQGEWLRGMRGLSYSAALLFSLVSELARLQHLQTLSLPPLPGLPSTVAVPSALATEMLAAVLIVLDPLVVTPLIRWIEDGVVRGDVPGDAPA